MSEVMIISSSPSHHNFLHIIKVALETLVGTLSPKIWRSISSCDDQDHLEPKVLLASFRKMPGASGCRVGRKRPTHALNNLSGDDKSTLSSSSMTRTEHCVCFYSHHIVLLIFISWILLVRFISSNPQIFQSFCSSADLRTISSSSCGFSILPGDPGCIKLQWWATE